MIEFIPSFLIAYSNSDFTNPHEVVLPDDPMDCTADHTHMGVKYWGLETKRHWATHVDQDSKKIYYNHDAYQWLKIGFKKRALVDCLKVSTKWFTGNQVRAISVILFDELKGAVTEVLSKETLQPDNEHHFDIPDTMATECFIKLYHEGGIARINFFGSAAAEQPPTRENILRKATISHVSNEHYGNPKMAVDGCREQMHMVGWESARTGFGEQAIFHLAEPSQINEIVVDTYLHRLNPPMTCHIFGLLASEASSFEACLPQLPKWTLRFEDGTSITPPNFQEYMLSEAYLKEPVPNPSQFEIELAHAVASPWKAILPFEALAPDTYHRFTKFEVQGEFSHLLYLHYPNGGVHGLKVF